MSDHIAARQTQGQVLTQGAGGTFWRPYSKRVVTRFPDLTLTVPEPAEIRRAMKNHRCCLAAYNREPDAQHPANAVLYLCTNRAYSIEHLGANSRRKARRAQRELRIEPIDWNTLSSEGLAVFRATRERFGLRDGTLENFQGRLGSFLANPAHHSVGAWRGDTLLAFATVRAIDDWAEIEGMFTANEGGEYYPGNGIVHHVLEMFLGQGILRAVSYGFSSIQHQTRAAVLHQFKLNVGFEAMPVYRAFVLRSWLRPAVNPLTLKIVQFAARKNPANKMLRAAEGVLSTLLPPSHPRSVEEVES